MQEVEAGLKSLREKLAHSIQMQNDAATSVSMLDAEIRGTQARLIELSDQKLKINEKQNAVRLGWAELKRFGYEPDANLVEALTRRLVLSRLTVQEATSQIGRLREGRFIFARQRSHGVVLEQIREHLDGAMVESREQLVGRFSLLLVQKQEELQDVIQVKEITKDAAADISTELADFNSAYIDPLGQLMSRINQAILCDPRVGIDLHVTNKKVEQTAVKGSQVPRTAGGVDPILVHSEGQMAALAVSMLCAASLTFPWSRWKALVLDDPLQHNDSIHAAAFADFMGNLVSTEGYQVLISTHDLAQAQFLQRKFSSRRIPCQTLSLLGQGN
jgi:hypothetical protein